MSFILENCAHVLEAYRHTDVGYCLIALTVKVSLTIKIIKA